MPGPSPPSSRPSSALVTASSSKSALQRSQITRQVILDEDEYASALSSIVRRDFFPHLDKLAATNDYLGALEAGDPESVAKALRRLREVGRDDEKKRHPNRGSARRDAPQGPRESAREIAGTPFVNRTPFARGDLGERSWDTPFSVRDQGETVHHEGESSDWIDTGDAQVASKRRRLDDLTTHAISTSSGIDAFQSTYTSEDNASFLRLLREENAARRERHQWAYDAEQKHEARRLKIEQARRRRLIEAGGHVAEDDGLMGAGKKRVMPPRHPLALEASADGGALSDDAQDDRATLAIGNGAQRDERASRDEQRGGGQLEAAAEMMKQGHSLQVATRSEASKEHQLTKIDASVTTIANALPRAPLATAADDEDDNRALVEFALRPDSHLALALAEAGLPSTAFAARLDDESSTTSGQVGVVPAREVASGADDGLGRGEEERQRREMIEAEVWADQKETREAIVPDWKFKARNSLMFPPDVDVDPNLPKEQLASTAQRQAPKQIKHANTRLHDQDDEEEHVGSSSRSSQRASSPSRSRVAAAIHGTLYPASDRLPTFGSFALVPDEPSPSPESLGPAAVSELMTWGSILATPRALDSSSTEEADPRGYRFSIAPEGGRDRLGRKLADDASRSMRQRAKGYGTSSGGDVSGLGLLVRPSSGTPSSQRRRTADGDMGPPSMTPRRTAQDLTPAGRSLLERTRAGSATPLSGSRASVSSAARHSRQQVMERAGGWGVKGRASGAVEQPRRPPAQRTW